jgi:hypothetical protein
MRVDDLAGNICQALAPGTHMFDKYLGLEIVPGLCELACAIADRAVSEVEAVPEVGSSRYC